MKNVNIKRISELSYLKIDDKDVEIFEKNFLNTIKMIEKIPNINLIEENLEDKNVEDIIYREDIIKPSLNREDFLKNTKETQAGCVLVCKTINSI